MTQLLFYQSAKRLAMVSQHFNCFQLKNMDYDDFEFLI